MPQNNDVCVAFERTDRVRKRLPFGNRRVLHFIDGNDTPPEALHGRDERGRRSCRRFVKQIGQDLPLQQVNCPDPLHQRPHFHPHSEDFIQGVRPKTGDDGKSLTYPTVPGRFLQFCKEARIRNGVSVLIIDEINRANLSRVFGELMYLLEYRDRQIPLSGGGYFQIPPNVYIIGTMNTADRSIALVDHALRRRFAFLELGPNYEIVQRFYEEKPFNPEGLLKVLEKLNQEIGDKHYEVGISYFLLKDRNISDHIEDIWRMEIEPYLEEFFFDQPDKVNSFRWEKVEDQIIR